MYDDGEVCGKSLECNIFKQFVKYKFLLAISSLFHFFLVVNRLYCTLKALLLYCYCVQKSTTITLI